MKTKLKSSIIAYHMAVGHRVAAAMVCALCAVGLSAFAEESVTINEVKSLQPWDKAKGTITVDYSLGGLDAATDYKVAFDITAGGQTASVTNDATKLTDGAATKEIDTAKLFGKQVVDTKAKVKVSLIAIKASSEPEYVEIGGVKWATKNLGAEKVTDYGDYFAWSATELAYSSLSSDTFTFVASRPASYGGSGWTQSSGFANENTPYYDGSAYTKYTSSDSKTVLESSDDAATALLGSGWRMPTSAEFQALYDACGGSCDKTTNPGKDTSVGKGVYWCTSYDGVAGCLFCDGTNKLFFPAAGCGSGTSLKNAGSFGYYWSGSLHTGNTISAKYLVFYSGYVSPQSFTIRYNGYSVRPVKDAAKPVAPEGFVDLGVKDADGKPLFWAEKNLGASNPQDGGDYFAWGETAPYYTTTGGWPATPAWKSEKESGYAWQSYCGSSSFSEWSTPPYDATKILKPEFDAATEANSSWRTPTKEEFVALAANCVWIWCDGVSEKYKETTTKGYIVYKAKDDSDKGKAKIGNTWKKWDVSQSKYVTDGASEATGYTTTSDTHIFFPAAGNGVNKSLTNTNSRGSYWSSSHYTSNKSLAYYLIFTLDDVNPQNLYNRCNGFSVRPVTN